MDYIKIKDIPEIKGITITQERINGLTKSILFVDENHKTLFMLSLDKYGDSIECYTPKPPEKKTVFLVKGHVGDGLVDIEKQFENKGEAELFIRSINSKIYIETESSLKIEEIEIEI